MHELLKAMGRTFLMVTAGALFSMAVIISIFDPQMAIGVEELWHILFVALFSGLSHLVFYAPRRELDAKQMLVRKLIQPVIVLGTIGFFAFRWRWMELTDMPRSILFVTLVLLVYAVTIYASFRQDKKTSELLNQRLREYKKEGG